MEPLFFCKCLFHLLSVMDNTAFRIYVKKSLQSWLKAVGRNSSWGPIEVIKCLHQIMELFRVEKDLTINLML